MCYSLSIRLHIFYEMPDSVSIFTAKIRAIIKALEQIKNASSCKFIIFTDSLLHVKTLLYMKLEHPLIGMVIRKCVFLNITNKDIIVFWVLSHVGIRGNEKADSAAKSALDLLHAKVVVPYTDFKHLISQNNISTWQDNWNGAVVNKLHSVKPVLGERMKLSCVIPTSVIHFDPFIHLKDGYSTSV